MNYSAAEQTKALQKLARLRSQAIRETREKIVQLRVVDRMIPR
jgi:hypothetical protein